ncbi:hypothetical protein HAX54_053174 [Datura stramonium]|uniref:Uncharacterized protein n=1 Tax=Datura stramonium TaxID=4076 RepID=A0ABS8WPC8_DATST|nr:hypothetical protein [Datura stramonium]
MIQLKAETTTPKMDHFKNERSVSDEGSAEAESNGDDPPTDTLGKGNNDAEKPGEDDTNAEESGDKDSATEESNE